MDKRILLSTAYFPPIEYFYYLANNNHIFIEKYENYIKQSYRNRCYIYGANGKLSLNIPVKRNNQLKSLITDIEIDYSTNWNKIHLKSIVSAYKSSPFFDFYFDDIEPFLTNKYQYLWALNNDILFKLMQLLDIESNISHTKDFISLSSNNYLDLRYLIHPKQKRKYHKPNILKNEYYQVFSEKHGFIKNLSILDILFNMGQETLPYLKINNSNP